MAALKVSELEDLIVRFADVLAKNGAAEPVVASLRGLSGMFKGCRNMTVGAFLKAVSRVGSDAAESAQHSTADVVSALASLKSLLDGVAKKDLSNALDSLLLVLGSKTGLSAPALVEMVQKQVASASPPDRKRGKAEAMDSGLIEKYVKELEAALGDDARFKALLDELRSDSRIRQAEAVSIATRFSGQTSPKTSRSKALDRILERHTKLMKFKSTPSAASRPAA